MGSGEDEDGFERGEGEEGGQDWGGHEVERELG